MKNINELIHNLRLLLGAKLVSVILYGAKALENNDKLNSNIDLIVVVEELSGADLKLVSKIINKWKNLKNPAPIFLDKNEWYSSSDVYAMEYDDIKNTGRVLYGEDLISSINVEREDLRFQCELEIKNLLVKFRQYYLDNLNSPRNLKKTLILAAKSCFAIFKTILRLNGETVSPKKSEIVESLSNSKVIDGALFTKLLCMKENKCKVSDKEADALSLQLISELTKLLMYVDKI